MLEIILDRKTGAILSEEFTQDEVRPEYGPLALYFAERIIESEKQKGTDTIETENDIEGKEDKDGKAV